MLSALQWLQANNVYYRNFNINTDTLALLPEDGDISGLTSVTFASSANHELPSEEGEHPYDSHLARTFVPISGRGPTEQENIK